MSKKILVVEDEHLLRRLLVQSLKEGNFEVIEAIDGEEGIVKAKEERPDLILLDLILPGISGYEVLLRMKKDPLLEKIPVIVLSNLGQEEEIERAKRLGAKDFMIKAHFTLSQIKEKIEEFFGKNS